MLPPIIFIVLCVLISVFVNKKVPNGMIACTISGVTTSIIYQVIGILVVGYLDPFFMFAFIIGFVVACVLSLIVRVVLDFIRFRSTGNDD
jgi:hypothetical protein